MQAGCLCGRGDGSIDRVHLGRDGADDEGQRVVRDGHRGAGAVAAGIKDGQDPRGDVLRQVVPGAGAGGGRMRG